METNFTTPENNGNESFSQQIGDAFIHLLYRLVYFLFILPFGLWKNAVIRMSKQRRSGALDVTTIHTEWPFLSWLKRFIFEFLFDALTIISWIIGLIVVIIVATDAYYFNFFAHFLLPLYAVYLFPFYFSIVRDCTTIFVVLPIRWMISFFRRPAKTYDLTHVGKVER